MERTDNAVELFGQKSFLKNPLDSIDGERNGWFYIDWSIVNSNKSFNDNEL